MWLAAVCSLMNSVLPISRLLQALGDEAEDLDLAERQPVRRAATRARRAERADAGEQRRHADLLRQLVGLAEQLPGAVAPVAAAPQQHAAVLVRGVGDPRAGAQPAVELHRPLEVRLGALPLAERRRQHAEVAVGGAVAGDHVADQRVRCPRSGSSSG